MEANVVNYGLAFLEGFALIISPCILPILPIILSGTLEGGSRRPLGIILGFVLTFALFTLFSRALVEVLAINLDILRGIAFSLIILFGIILMSDYLSEKFSQITQPLANLGASVSVDASHGFLGGLVLGALVSLIWVPCAGPILASVLVQTAVQKTSLQSFITFFFFALGSVIPMLLIALLGRQLISKIDYLKKHTHLLRKIFGLIIVIGALIAAFTSSVTLYSKKPTFFHETFVPAFKEVTAEDKLVAGLPTPYPAPNLEKISDWINTAEFTLGSLKGKVVLLDFWTYSCINCIRTLPYLKSWYQKYHDKGLVIIGVHTPEFAFEKNPDNVKMAVENFGIQYPVVLDNDYATWNNYQNHYWPAHYLIDTKGEVVYIHFGEGGYAETEHNIRYLLGIKPEKHKHEDSMPGLSRKISETKVIRISQEEEGPGLSQKVPETAETYLGVVRADIANSPEKLGYYPKQAYVFPDTLHKDAWALNGNWTVDAENIISAENNAAIRIHFFAAKVFSVMGSQAQKPIVLKVLLDGKPIPMDKAGKDVKDAELVIAESRLYSIINLETSQDGILELQAMDEGAMLYTFTFGGRTDVMMPPILGM